MTEPNELTPRERKLAEEWLAMCAMPACGICDICRAYLAATALPIEDATTRKQHKATVFGAFLRKATPKQVVTDIQCAADLFETDLSKVEADSEYPRKYKITVTAEECI